MLLGGFPRVASRPFPGVYGGGGPLDAGGFPRVARSPAPGAAAGGGSRLLGAIATGFARGSPGGIDTRIDIGFLRGTDDSELADS